DGIRDGHVTGVQTSALPLLALAIHALGVSAQYLFIAFKPDLFVSLDEYRQALAAEIAAIKATPRQDGVAEIRIPGERAYRERARSEERRVGKSGECGGGWRM